MDRLKMKMTSKQSVLDCYEKFHDPKYLELDPLLIIRDYLGSKQLEEVALIGALFAFGAVSQIKKSLSIALSKTEQIDHTQILDENKIASIWFDSLQGFRHRIYVDRDLVLLKLLYRRSLQRYGSLEQHFIKHHQKQSESVEQGLAGLIQDYRTWADEIDFKPGRFFKHMLNSPEQKSACKRWVMYLKWVVRKNDGFDLGLWQSGGVRPDQLVIPMDTHLFKISKRLKLTKRKTVNWLTALEVTRSLKKIDPEDPTRFDFSLCRIGMLKYRKMI
jgi:uncharacterized protein (TIGR02757 family)